MLGSTWTKDLDCSNNESVEQDVSNDINIVVSPVLVLMFQGAAARCSLLEVIVPTTPPLIKAIKDEARPDHDCHPRGLQVKSFRSAY